MSNHDLNPTTDDCTAHGDGILQRNLASGKGSAANIQPAEEVDPAPGELVRRADAAKYVEDKYGFGCSKRTLAKLACVGGGPRFRMAGRVPLYPKDELDAWARAKIGPLIKSTSEIPAAA